jgi:hypothetical protein
MTRILILAAAALSLGACASMPGVGAKNTFGEGVLGNLQHCSRTYIGNVGLGSNLSVTITCEPKPFDAESPAESEG